MLRTNDVIKEEDAIYLPPIFFSESGCAKRLLTLMTSKRTAKIDTAAVLARVLKYSKIVYDEVQKEAIRQAISS